ncbi:MAG: sorbosone dehydrogenase family protein, partial [Gammaproteobacteria bacterium]
MRNVPRIFLGLAFVIAAGTTAQADIQLDRISLPDGFRIHLYTDRVDNARGMVLGDKGTVFVGSRKKGKVYAVRDTDGDHVGDEVVVIARYMDLPVGVAFRAGALYISAKTKIVRFDDIENRLDDLPNPVVVRDGFPDKHHGWKNLAFGPDDKLYFQIGAPCNICNEGADFATIARMNPDGSDYEVYARGVRNSLGLDWHPDTGELWFSDNGRDWLGDDLPPDELNHAPKPGMHFGFPYCHGGDIPDPEFGEGHDCA